MAMNVGSAGGVKSEINVTPLVDVVLVLLIIFMVITPLLQMGYEVTTPPEIKSAVPPPPSDQIILRLDRQGRMYINKESFSAADFPTRLEEAMRNREASVVFFAADGELEFGRVADFLDICRNHGAKNLGVVFEDIGTIPAAASALGAR
jgi:biopolymer transport protein ExbD